MNASPVSVVQRELAIAAGTLAVAKDMRCFALKSQGRLPSISHA